MRKDCYYDKGGDKTQKKVTIYIETERSDDEQLKKDIWHAVESKQQVDILSLDLELVEERKPVTKVNEQLKEAVITIVDTEKTDTGYVYPYTKVIRVEFDGPVDDLVECIYNCKRIVHMDDLIAKVNTE